MTTLKFFGIDITDKIDQDNIEDYYDAFYFKYHADFPSTYLVVGDRQWYDVYLICGYVFMDDTYESYTSRHKALFDKRCRDIGIYGAEPKLFLISTVDHDNNINYRYRNREIYD